MARPIRSDDLLKFVFAGDSRISPDGETVLFGRKTINEKNAYITHLWTVPSKGGEPRQLTQGEKGVGGGRWSPDGSLIAFTSARTGNGPQIWLLPSTGGEARKLTSFEEGSVGEIVWSPDGKYIATTFRPALERDTKAAAKAREEKGLSMAPIVTEEIWYRLDGDGYFGDNRYTMLILDSQTGEKVTEYKGSPQGDFAFDWHPSGDRLVVAHSASKQPMKEAPNEQLFLLKLDGSAEMLPGLPKGDKSRPRFSPDGTQIAYSGDVDEHDPWGVRNTKLYVVSAEGGKPRDLTGPTDLDFAVATLSDSSEASFGSNYEWLPDGKGLVAQVGTKGEQQIATVTLEGDVNLVTSGQHTALFTTVSEDGAYVYGSLNTATILPEVARFDVKTGEVTPLTSFNKAFHDEVELFTPEEHWVETTDGLKVHVWVIRPTAPNGAACLNIHGGPHCQYGWAIFHEFQVQAAAGYTVIYSNPRGSKGYGEAWCAAIQGDWGHKDWEDVSAVKDWMKTLPGVDAKRMAVMGGSYGGYMSSWVIGHTDDFACSIVDRCVSNMVSMAGNSDFPFNKDGYFKGYPDGGLEAIAGLWKQSPMAYLENCKTPALIVHSEGDLRCNVEQGEQVYAALQMRNIPTRFVRYPSTTSHGLSRSGPLDLRQHRLGEYIGWLDRFLK
ncbi:S9 family peptidase [bacterium]|nr:MAG: S9 family peptidase [bacterium]